MDKHFFGLAGAEVARGQIDAALLVKAVALSEGDEVRGKALYIVLRADEIAQEYERRDDARSRRDEAASRQTGDPDMEEAARALKDVLWILPLALLGLALVLGVVGSFLE